MKFEDRISEYPGRIKLTDENGEAHYYTLERADEPTQPGTPLSAENLNKLTQDVNGKTGASIVLTGDDISISASDNTTVKERIDNARSAASEAQSMASAAQSTADTALSNQKQVVLWENKNMNATFTPQKINVDFKSYKIMILYFYREPGISAGTIANIITTENLNLMAVSVNNAKISIRTYSVLSDGVNFENASNIANYSNYTINNNELIPYKIVGILK